MSDNLPVPRRIDGQALRRIIQRATELQTSEAELGEGLTEEELLSLGEEVGIAPTHLRRAMQEERTRALAAADSTAITWLVGARQVAAARTIAGDQSKIEDALSHWMLEGELLQVRRRYPDRVSYERREGAWASLRRSFGFGGHKYLLARAKEVVTHVVSLDDLRCLVQLVADLSNTRNERLVGSGLTIGAGAATTGMALVLGVMAPVAVVPVALGAPLAILIARSRRTQLEEFRVALEQILDRLEHGDLDQSRKLGRPGVNVIDRIAEEIRRNL
ncbi:MAG: hypothetical protein AMS18_01845 [Gemmatimonas sp. SG8_17]|nr:MAG: hypothetical protein AMS18_01845 [Gemmatimonas sp. SG8_17]